MSLVQILIDNKREGTYSLTTHKVVPRDAVVLDLDAANDHITPGEIAEAAIKTLRDSPWLSDSALADQIEAQTKPPRIPEPGFGERVEASLSNDVGGVRVFVRHRRDNNRKRWTDGHDPYAWEEFIDPVLIRPGV